MRKIFVIGLLFLFFSCQQDERMEYLQTITFDIQNDVYIEGYSDAEQPFLYFASGNNMLYKHYIDSNRIDSIDLEKKTKINYFNRYFIIFNKEEYILNQSDLIYNSFTDKLYQLDSLSDYNSKLQFVISSNDVSSWDNNKFLIVNWFHCGVGYNDYQNKKERQAACQQINEKQPSYSILDFDNNALNLSTITLGDIRPNPEYTNDLSTLWIKSSSIFVNDVVLFNNHFIDGVYEINQNGDYKKVITIKSKYTKFDKEDKKGDRIDMIRYALDYATQTKRILYDEYREKILIVLVHGTEDIEKNGDKKGTNRPFSVLVYDTDYNFENEYLFDNSKYNYKNIYVCKEGLAINANNKLGNMYKPQKLIYEIFAY